MTLGGATLAYNAISQDYCVIETLNCLYDLCDQVSIACGGDDGTVELVMDWASDKILADDKKSLRIVQFSIEDWQSVEGPTKLSYFSNLAIGLLDTDYIFYLQADEIIHERSFENIRAAIETGENGFVVARYNLWKDPFHMLNVPQERKPCSTEVIRLAKQGYFCFSDAEHLAVDEVKLYKTLDAIEIFHVGYIRNGKKHLVKIRHIQVEVFRTEMDKRAEDCEEFLPERWFSEEDLIWVPFPLPKYIKQWCIDRHPQLEVYLQIINGR
jgi:hypothetical protein